MVVLSLIKYPFKFYFIQNFRIQIRLYIGMASLFSSGILSCLQAHVKYYPFVLYYAW